MLTDEQLAAIGVELEYGRRGIWTISLFRAAEQLWAEVERLTAERDKLWNDCAFAQAERDEAHAAGFAEAVAMLRDDGLYTNWWTALPEQDPAYGYWQQSARRHLADYLETLETLKLPEPGRDRAVSSRLPAVEGSGTPEVDHG